jgi:DNA polymerase II small subunit
LDKKEIGRKATEYGLILSSVALDRIAELELDYEAVFRDGRDAGEWFISPEYIEARIAAGKHGNGTQQPNAREEACDADGSPKVLACNMQSRLLIHDDSDVTGKSTCAGDLEDFVGYFNARFESLRKVLQERVEYRLSTSIEAVRKNATREKAKIICMVKEKRDSSKGHRFLEVEDATGELTVLLSDKRDDDRKEPAKNAYERILHDEVIGITGVLNGDLFIATEVVQPEVPLNHVRRFADEEVYAIFLSDIHVGSYLFLEREFQSFIDWLKGRGGRQDIAEKVKYIIVAGDLVDGIGIYPDQEKELTIPDIMRQYEFLAMLLSEIPSHIDVVLCMGNHDAVRNAEPQPRISKELAPALFELTNVHITGNPVRLSAHGVEFLVYHGTSLDTIIGNLSGSSYTRPETAMIELLKRRHLVPTYGSDSISPENKDYLFIGDVPDVFHCGHVHTNGYTLYHGVNVINSGTWQAKTAYQERLGHQPTPAMVPVMNLQNHEVSMLDFNGNGRTNQ